MGIRIVLIGAICLLFIWLAQQGISTRGRALSKVGSLLFFALAVTVILFPDMTTEIAQHLGVGRGADLLLYGLCVAYLTSMLILYTHRRQDQNKVVNIARHIAIIEAMQDERNQRLLQKVLKR